LFEDGTWLADYSSFSSNVLTFENSSGLFTVPAGQSKTVTLKVDLANGTGSGKTIAFSVSAESDIDSDASAVNGTFPLSGNLMSTAAASDLGKLTIATTTAAGGTERLKSERLNLPISAQQTLMTWPTLSFTMVELKSVRQSLRWIATRPSHLT